MLGFYLQLPWWIRVPIAVGTLALGLWLSWNARSHYAKFVDSARDTSDPLPMQNRDTQTPFYAGMILTGLGIGLLATCGRTPAERNGYRSI